MARSRAIPAHSDDTAAPASQATATALAEAPWLSINSGFLAAGLAALVLPTLLSLARNYWSTDNGVHGPIILVSGLWLLWRERDRIHLRPGSISPLWLAALLPPLLLLYIYARGFGVLTAESASLYALLVLLGLYYWSPEAMRRLWFAIFYLGFLIRPPSGLVAQLTQPLKVWISQTAVTILYWLGYPVANSGVRIQIAQYEVLVQEACAGLGSIFSLLAIGLLYIHLSNRKLSRRSLLLIIGIVPIAVIANVLRVIILLLLTYHVSDAVAQSFAHQIAGLTTFALALLGMFALDAILGLLQARR